MSTLDPATASWAPATSTLLTSEADLADAAHAAAIESFWHRVGRFGRFVGNGGLVLACAAFRQPDVASERGAVVVVNGRTESFVKYPEVVHDLWRNGYSVYVYDHRGQGLSQREPAVAAAGDFERGHVERFDDYVDDLLTFIETQVLAAGHRSHHLLTHSMGGAVAALLLERQTPLQTLFGAVALCSPMLAVRGPGGHVVGTGWCRVAMAARALGLGTRYALPSGGYTASPFDGNPFTRSPIRYARWRDAVERTPQVRLGAPTIGWLAASCAGMKSAREQADRIRVPVLVLVAGDDRIVHPSGTDEFWSRLSQGGDASARDGRTAPHVRASIAGARHELLIERDAARGPALREVLRFFADPAPAR